MIQIEQAMLKAVALAAAVKDIRYYLNGVLVEVQGGRTWLVGTDGNRMHVGQGLVVTSDDAKIVIPTAVVKQACAKKATILHLTIESPTKAKLDDVEFTPVEGVFPDWRRVLPRQNLIQPEYTSLKPHHLYDFSRGCKELGVREPSVTMHFYENVMGHVYLLKSHVRQDFIGLCVGVRPTISDERSEGWVAAQSNSLPHWI